MNTLIENGDAKEAFNKQSPIFDDIYANNIIVNYKRDRTRSHVEKYLAPGDKLLELNSGTGQDAIYFSQKGYQVHATDVSEGMLNQLQRKIDTLNLAKLVTYENLSFVDISNLRDKRKFNAIFSNFGGLNCTNQLEKVLAGFSPLLEANGLVTLVIMPPFCLWEFLNIFRGKFTLAFRRFNSNKGARAHIEGVHFLCWYYKPSFVINYLEKDFTLLELEGLCTIVPPSYMDTFPVKYPRLWKLCTRLEARLKNTFPFTLFGDYFIITLQKKDNSQ